MEKELNTRIQLKYDTYENWTTNDPTLKAGEMAIATIAESAEGVQGTPPIVIIKVGDGSTAYTKLPFVSGYAANVYAWAKAKNKPTYSASEITGLSDTYATTESVTQAKNEAVSTAQSYTDTQVQEATEAVESLQSTLSSTYMPLAGGTFTGAVTLASDPSSEFEAATKKYVDAQIVAQVQAVFKFKGTVDHYADLNDKNDTAAIGDVWHVKETSSEYVWAGTGLEGANEWQEIGHSVDLSAYPNSQAVDQKIQAALKSYLALAGGTMTGVLVLSGDPTEDNHAATKKYVDDAKAAVNASLADKQDTVEFDSDYNSITNKAATVATVTGAISELEFSDSAVANQFVTSVSETAGVVSVTRAQPTTADIKGLTEALAAKVESSTLAAIAKSGEVKDLQQTDDTILVFNCGNSTTNF